MNFQHQTGRSFLECGNELVTSMLWGDFQIWLRWEKVLIDLVLMELVQKGKKRKGKKKKKKKNAIKVNQYIQTKPQGLGSCCASG